MCDMRQIAQYNVKKMVSIWFSNQALAHGRSPGNTLIVFFFCELMEKKKNMITGILLREQKNMNKWFIEENLSLEEGFCPLPYSIGGSRTSENHKIITSNLQIRELIVDPLVPGFCGSEKTTKIYRYSNLINLSPELLCRRTFNISV